ncbi:MAG: GNAT family N-acetyltransferase [Aquabacterium sp.]|uniref:bifunctional acetate--CoA ligase family protein/GNAT family N-acetyltransferase n=1 Tax=Aquabacterium sp. TaxID=1872578 RepID=UPI001209C658|nr:bifunctional acetate--CoA ligase family protein/GNAT family N-acetyltransferase [Aquabacterium sp.]TAK97676.1 MAG: GNAT family N-acetyltransferase [Aquabacterium sp.]
MDAHYLAPLFAPKAIVVFADAAHPEHAQSPHAPALLQALKGQRFNGTLQFVSTQTSGTLADLMEIKADLAIIALPPSEVPAAIELAARMACQAVMVLSSGVDSDLASAWHKQARREGIYLLGPNCLGFQRPSLGLNASTLGPLAEAGPLALVSQSGSLTASMLDWAARNAVSFSSVVSLGPHASVGLAEALDFLANDPKTQSILIYMEGIWDARRFMSTLRSAANAKPVIVLKAGRHSAGQAAARTHSAAMVGDDEVFDAALRRAGAVRVKSFDEMFSAAKCLASRVRPVGKRLAILTNGGGPGVLAADRIHDIELALGQLSAETAKALQAVLPALASLVDLIDLSEDATPEHFKAALESANRDSHVDGLLVIYSPKLGTAPVDFAKAVVSCKPDLSKPLLTCWMGDDAVADARVVLNDANIPTYRTPESAVGAFGYLSSFYQNQQLLQQTPPPLSTLAKPDIEGARLVIECVLAERRKVLTEMESKSLLSAFHIPVTETILARSAHEAMMIATQLGFPVALKIDSPDISHKSDVQGVTLNITSGAGVRDAYNDMMDRVKRLSPEARINGVTVQQMARTRAGREICIGVVTDDAFGPVVAFGAGGTMIELINDRAMELPPLNQYLARRLIERARVAETLGEWRGLQPVDLDAVERVLLRVSEMVCELPQLREMDINPLIIDEDGAVAVDARIVIDSGPHVIGGRAGAYSHLPILPYPARYEQIWPLRDGGEYTIRPIHTDDAQMLQELVQSLSSESRYFRFVSSMTELPPTMLAKLTLIDYDREMALVAVYKERQAQENGEIVERDRIIGVSRYITNPDQTSCEFSLVVADAFSGKGLGSRLMESIMDVARERGLTEIIGLVLTNNDGMLRLMRSLGFTVKPYPEDPDFRLVTHPL